MRQYLNRFIFELTILVLGFLSVQPALSQTKLADFSNDITTGTLISHAGEGDIQTLPLVSSRVKMKIVGQIARVKVVQYFDNTSDNWLEALYLFPLPHDAAVDQMRMIVGDKIIEGQIQEKKAAKTIYEKAKSEGQQTALIEQDKPNVFSTSVANIPPTSQVKIEIEYQQTIEWRDDLFSLRFPMSITPRYEPEQPIERKVQSKIAIQNGWSILPNERPHMLPLEEQDNTPDNKTSIEIDFIPGFEIDQIQSLFHRVNTKKVSTNAYAITLTDDAIRADRDFVLTWKATKETSPTAAFFRESGQNSELDYGLLTILPPFEDKIIPVPREVTFVIDTSGSMGGESIRAAKRALEFGLTGLTKFDTFNIIEFNSSAASLFSTPQPAFGRPFYEARRFVRELNAGGGTEMAAAIELALSLPGDKSKLQQIVFITDGATTHEQYLLSKIKHEIGIRRLFTVGIGYAPNTYFMETASEMGRGTYTYIGDINMAEKSMTALFQKISKPALTDITVTGYGISDVVPQTFPDLYAGEPLSMYMRVHPGLSHAKVTGRVGNTKWEQIITLSDAGTQSGVSTGWAREKIEAWERQSINGVDAGRIKNEVTKLALKHHLVSAHTSLVAVDVTPIRPDSEGLIDAISPPTRPYGLDIKGLQFAKGSTDYQQLMMMAFVIIFLSLSLLILVKRKI